MRHAILGAGGVGGLVGAALAKSGDAVTLVLRPEALKDYPAELSLESPLGSFSVPVQRVAQVAQPFDVLWIAVKATHLDAALRSVTNAEQIGAIVPLLNGIDHVALLRALCEPLAVAGHEMQTRLDRFDQLVVGGRRSLEHRATGDEQNHEEKPLHAHRITTRGDIVIPRWTSLQSSGLPVAAKPPCSWR